jgi:hypothetical protein
MEREPPRGPRPERAVGEALARGRCGAREGAYRQMTLPGNGGFRAAGSGSLNPDMGATIVATLSSPHHLCPLRGGIALAGCRYPPMLMHPHGVTMEPHSSAGHPWR